MEIEFWSERGVREFLKVVSHPSVSPAFQLTTLKLRYYRDTENFEDDDDDYEPTEYLSPFGGSAPRLEQLTLCGVHVDWDQPWISSASNLTHLELASHFDDVSPSWIQFATMLRGAPKLKKLSLYWSGPSGNPYEWVITSDVGITTKAFNSPIPLPDLTDLVLGHHSQTLLIALFRVLYMPSLKTLSLECHDDTNLVRELAGPATSIGLPSAGDGRRSLLSGLESIKLSFLPQSKESAEILCAELHSLESLTIALHPTFLELILSPCTVPGLTTWLPLLKTLYISWIWHDPVAVREPVQRRKDVGVPLKSVYLEERCRIDQESLAWFKSNVDEFNFFVEEENIR